MSLNDEVSDTDEELYDDTYQERSLILKQPPIIYKSTITFTGGVDDMRKYIQSYYSMYFNDCLWLVIQYETFSTVYRSNSAYITHPYKSREYIDNNTPYVVNRVNQPLDIIISDKLVRVRYIKPYGDCVYNADFNFFATYKFKVTELSLISILTKK
jgi:hypothetical protein